MLDFVLNRKGGVPVRDQLATQLELKILDGSLAPGQKLPSVRALARRLDVHPNTVSAAYQDLKASGHLELRRGSGVFVGHRHPSAFQEARDLDEMIRLALQAATGRGYSGAEIRSAVERWLRAAPPERVVVVDPSPEMAELVAHELRQALAIPASSCALSELARQGDLLSGALVLSLPYHTDAVSRLAPAAAHEVFTLEVAKEDRRAILSLPQGSLVLVVSHSPTVLPFASVLLRSLRGDEVLVEARLLSAGREWRRLLPAADLVFADALSVEAVRRSRARKIREYRVLTEAALARLRKAIEVVVPRLAAGPAKA